MKIKTIQPGQRSRWLVFALLGMLFRPGHAHASLFKGEALDTVADVMSCGARCRTHCVAISVFWLVHILPEKIAEKRQRPQAKAIQTLCLLSLFFKLMKAL